MAEEIDYNAVNWQGQFTSKIHRNLYPLLDPHNNPALSAAAAGKVVLVTGVSGGIGQKLAEAWILAGAAGVVITGRNAEKLEEANARLCALTGEMQEKNGERKTKLLCVRADVTKEEDVASLWESAGTKMGTVDVLINNAGSLTQAKIGQGAPGHLWRDFEVNVKGAQLNIHHFLHQLPPTTIGTVIGISTGILGETYPNFASYIPSKLAAAKYMEFLHAERPNVRCFSVFPGLVATDMPPKEYLDMALDDPMLTGGLSLWLCTEKSEWLRGGCVSVNWDFEEMEEHREEILEKGLIRLAFTGAKFGKGGHPWERQVRRAVAT